jgi:hypothetical protein
VACLGMAAMILLGADARTIGRSRHRWRLFPLYLTGVGVIAAIVYPLSRPLHVATVRYGLLVLYAPIGLAALMLHPARRAALRAIATACILIFAVGAAIDHIRVIAAAVKMPPPSRMRQVVTRLEQRGVEVASADYWRAYVITFMSGEKIKVASEDFVRINEYNALAARRSSAAGQSGVVRIQADPCAARGERVGGWYLCDE